jgi:outer membrane protein TolC
VVTHRTRLLTWICALCLSACASMTAVKPVASKLQANDLDAGGDIEGAATTAWPDAAWWRLYGDPQLNRLIEEAVAGSPRIAAAQARIRVAQGMASISDAALQPSIEGGADIDRTRFSHDYYIPEDINGHYLFRPVWNNSAGLTLAYSFDFWGRDRAALEASLGQVKVSEYEAQNARLTLQGTVIRTYAELEYAYEIEDHERAILDAVCRLDSAPNSRSSRRGTPWRPPRRSSRRSRTTGCSCVISWRRSVAGDPARAMRSPGLR